MVSVGGEEDSAGAASVGDADLSPLEEQTAKEDDAAARSEEEEEAAERRTADLILARRTADRSQAPKASADLELFEDTSGSDSSLSSEDARVARVTHLERAAEADRWQMSKEGMSRMAQLAAATVANPRVMERGTKFTKMFAVTHSVRSFPL